MVKRTRKVWVLMVALMAFGAAKWNVEHRLTGELRAAGLAGGNLQLGTWEKIDQTTWMVAMGGLRTLVATFLDLRAYTFFTQQRWGDVRDTYETMVDLAPQTRYYWESGSWHQAYNAASYYINDSALPPLRRREAWREAIVWGRAFLERGIRNNPEDGKLQASLGLLLLDSNKFTAFADRQEAFESAAAAYRKASRMENGPVFAARFELYALARVRGREAEALELARRLYASNPRNRTPTLLTLLYALEAHADPERDAVDRALAVFGSEDRAYRELSRYWLRTREGYPLDGVALALQGLESRLQVDPAQSILRQTPSSGSGPNDWFSPR